MRAGASGRKGGMRALDLEFLEECLRARIITMEEFREAIEQDVAVYSVTSDTCKQCESGCDINGGVKGRVKHESNC